MQSDEDNPTFATVLRQYRRAAGLTQEELAERARLSVRGITDLERGARRSPRKETVQLLADALQLAAADRQFFEAAARPHSPLSVKNGEAAGRMFAVPSASTVDDRVIVNRAQLPSDSVGTGRTVTGMAQRGAATRHNLPAALSGLIGRKSAAGEVRDLLAEARLVTLVGSGGVGKTRLALAVAGDLVEQQPAGVWLVELAALSDPALVPEAVAQALGLREEPGRSLLATLQDHLKHKELLLVLDNCEHLVVACAALVGALLRSAPELRILATSREGLQIGGEQRYRVPSLAVPDPTHLPSGEPLDHYASVQLFVARARVGRQNFDLDERTGPAVAAVCARLDGIPLAIELAAARMSSLSVEVILARLDQSMRLLTGGSRDALPRQQTLRATLDWSWDLLSASEQTLLRRLSVFVGGWRLEAAEATCIGAEVEPEEVVDLLGALVNKSLVQAQEMGGEARYRLLEPVRQYSAERLLDVKEHAALSERHLDWCLSLAEEAEPLLLGSDQRRWLVRLEVEHDNLRAALGRSMAGEGTAGKKLRLATVLDSFWRMHGYMGEGWRWLEETLAHRDTCNAPDLRARALYEAGFLATRLGDFARAEVLLEEGLTLSREISNQPAIAHSLENLGEVAMLRGDYPHACELLEEGLAIFRELGDTLGIAQALGNLGGVAMFRGDYARARALLEEGLVLRRELDGMFSIAFALAGVGQVAYLQGEQGQAVAVLRESLLLSRDIDARIPVAISLECLACVTVGQGYIQRAARLGGAAEAVRATMGMPVQPEERASQDKMVQAVCASLGNEAFAAAWAEGRALPLEAAIAEALEGLTPA